MKIYIHTSGRATLTEQRTLGTMFGASKKNLRRVSLVVQASQAKDYELIASSNGVNMLVLPPEITRLSETRQHLLDISEKVFVMMDDDLLFFERRKDDDTKFSKIHGEQVFEMFDTLEDRMKGFAHGGILAREGGNRIVGKQNVYATRMMRVLAYDPKKVRKVGARFDRMVTKQDFDMTLQLLRAGYPNILMADYVQGQYGDGCSNAPGGCSVYRTPEMMDASAHKLAELHPGFVTVVQKESKVSWGGGVRTDVNIQWKKALQSSGASLP